MDESLIQDGGDPPVPLSLENSLWSNTVLASSGYILGLVVYTGKETRAQMNSQIP
jgi:phospholipid-translocating ATPase